MIQYGHLNNSNAECISAQIILYLPTWIQFRSYNSTSLATNYTTDNSSYVIFNVNQTHSLMTLQRMSFCFHSSVHFCSTTAAMLPSLSMWEHQVKWLSSTDDSIHQRSPFRLNFCAENGRGKSNRSEIRSLFSVCSSCTEATQLFIPTRKSSHFLTSSPCRRLWHPVGSSFLLSSVDRWLFWLVSNYPTLLNTLQPCQFTSSVQGSDASLVLTSKAPFLSWHRPIFFSRRLANWFSIESMDVVGWHLSADQLRQFDIYSWHSTECAGGLRTDSHDSTRLQLGWSKLCRGFDEVYHQW